MGNIGVGADDSSQNILMVPDRKQAYEHIARVLRRFSYWKLSLSGSVAAILASQG